MQGGLSAAAASLFSFHTHACRLANSEAAIFALCSPMWLGDLLSNLLLAAYPIYASSDISS